MPTPRLMPAALRVIARPMLAVAALMLLVQLIAAQVTSGGLLVGIGVTFLLVVGLGWLRLVLAEGVRLLSTPVLSGRNLTLPVQPVAALPDVAVRELGPEITAPVLVGLSLAVGSGSRVIAGSVAMSVGVVLATATPAWLAGRALGLRRSAYRRRMAEAVTDAVESLAPEVVLYFAGNPEELYQVEGWLAPLERLDRTVLVLVRRHEVVGRLRTSLPVVASPYTAPITRLSLPPRFVALFVTHSGDNVAMLRKAGAVSVFVGHGDSDKPDSINPVARVYDQVWVAGPLGRRRYDEAGVEVAAVVEVGRPQTTVVGSAAGATSVLYAPTWEGWGDDPHHSSLAHVGVALVRALLSHDVEVRYRPHPLTGRRDPSIRAAHQQILRLLEAAPNGRAVDTADEPLTASFAAASALVGDVSSVVGEFLAWDRPYAVVDTRDLGADELTARFPSTAGGFVVRPDLANLDSFVTAARGGDDPTASARHDLLLDTMGDPATSEARFAAAVDAALLRPS